MLAVVSGKGGCGKTTTALGLATACAASGTAVQVIDLDIEMPDLHVLAGVDRQPSLCAPRPADQLQPAPGRPGVFVGSAPRPDERTRIERSIATLPDRPTVLDAPAGAGRAATRPLTLADGALIVTTPQREATEDALKTKAIAETLDTPVVAVVVRGGRSLPPSLAKQFGVDASAVVTVPESHRDPLSDPAVTNRYIDLARRLGSCRALWEKGYECSRRTNSNE